MAGTTMYYSWVAMKNRCDPVAQAKRWTTYVGVTHCPEWATFAGFLANQPPGRPHEKGLVLSRIADKGNYEPSNCRWITKSENVREMLLRTKLRLPDGRFAVDVAAANGIPASAFHCRLHNLKWSALDAATRPLGALGTNGAQVKLRPDQVSPG
jgi:hypothetical protein